jgi:hypothetical protein
MPKRYPPSFSLRVLELVKPGRSVTEVADDLGVVEAVPGQHDLLRGCADDEHRAVRVGTPTTTREGCHWDESLYDSMVVFLFPTRANWLIAACPTPSARVRHNEVRDDSCA